MEKDPHSHGSDCSSSHRVQERRRLLWCLLFTAMTMFAELVGGYLSGSLALLSDAGHMFTDLFALLGSFLAILIAARPVNDSKTYGYYRAEVIAAFLNGLLLMGVSIYIFFEAYHRFFEPELMKPALMFWVALIGLLVNFATTWVLHGVKDSNLNMKGAYLHVISDTASSLAVVIAALVISKTGYYKIDPILSVLISVVILFWSFKVVRDSVHVLMEATPKHINLQEMSELLKKEVEGLKDLHDVHVWEITTHMYAMTAHVSVEDCKVSENSVRSAKIQKILSEKYHIEHVNLQYECE